MPQKRKTARLSRGERAHPGAVEARKVLAAHGIAPWKRRGQHFLIETPVLDQIVRAADIEPGETVVEIGPGLGVLTRELARSKARVITVEVDPRLHQILEREAPSWGDVHPLRADVLDLEVRNILEAGGVAGKPYKLVANLPYAITSPVIRMFLLAPDAPSRAVVMVQREVAQRLAARPGNYSFLSVVVRLFGTPAIVTKVPRTAFYPAPEVESAVVRIDAHQTPPVPLDDLEGFLDVVLAGFGHPRKQLHNSLSRRMWFHESETEALLQSLDIDPTRRAQTLSLEEWHRLYTALAPRLR